MTVDVAHARFRRLPACVLAESRHLDRAGFRRSPPDDDRRCKSRRPGSRPWRPSRGPRSTPGSARSTWLAAFSSRGACWLQFLEPRERGVEVCLVEDLAAVDQVAVDRRDSRSPATRRRSPRAKSPCAAWVHDRSEVAQPMHSLDVDVDVWREVPTRHGCMRSWSPDSNAAARRWSMFTQSGVVAGSSCRLSAA